MIRPLEYCSTSEHLRTSLNTIDERIREMLELREQYIVKLQSIEQKDTLLEVLAENKAFTEKITYHIQQKP